MKERSNPTEEQTLRRLRRPPQSIKDPRRKNDAYWALRLQGYPHAIAKRAFRDEKPYLVRHQRLTSGEYFDDLDASEILFPANTDFISLEVLMRPDLTEEVAQTAQPRQSEYTIWHDNIPGFGLRVRPSGHRSYILMYRVPKNRKQRKLSLGRAGVISLEEATEFARRLLRMVMAGHDPVRAHTR